VAYIPDEALLWHIFQMRRFWEARKQKKSIFFASEMIMALFKSNNPLQFHQFAERICIKTKHMGQIPIKCKSSFLREYKKFLFVTYGG
jgi:phenylacetate-coenzyme A ligase PaaK-like adenylate-forming protein